MEVIYCGTDLSVGALPAPIKYQDSAKTVLNLIFQSLYIITSL